MKNIIIGITLLFVSLATFANASNGDILSILTDNAVQNMLGDSEIESITYMGQRRYQILFSSCSVQVSVVSTCAPMPGGPCSREVKFNSAMVNCLP